ncbi:hypothetical protein [Stenotrophomonas forensis]|uniref:hypothetical protein n=1 Tax=Stenotrophomonas forensis TaxID=2871169 RepID=UPI0039C6E7F2
MTRSKKRRLRTMEKLRSRLNLLRGQQLALEAASAKCPIERSRKQAESKFALTNASQIKSSTTTSADGAEGESESAAVSSEQRVEGLLLRIVEALERIDARQAIACRPDFKSLSTRR